MSFLDKIFGKSAPLLTIHSPLASPLRVVPASQNTPVTSCPTVTPQKETNSAERVDNFAHGNSNRVEVFPKRHAPQQDESDESDDEEFEAAFLKKYGNQKYTEDFVKLFEATFSAGFDETHPAIDQAKFKKAILSDADNSQRRTRAIQMYFFKIGLERQEREKKEEEESDEEPAFRKR